MAELTDQEEMRYILDKNGNPVKCKDLVVWGAFFKNFENRKLLSNWKGKIHVSTVFLGIDHNMHTIGPPVLWETMIFNGEHDSYQKRYTSKEDAIKGHKEACKLAGVECD